MSRYERLLLTTYHGYDGDNMNVGKTIGSTTEYDLEAAIAGLLYMRLQDEKKRCEYVPRTKRQFAKPWRWARDLELTLRVNVLGKKDHFAGAYCAPLADQFPRLTWRSGDNEVVLVLSKQTALQPVETTVADLLRGLLYLI
jgi:hypothetical protein